MTSFEVRQLMESLHSLGLKTEGRFIQHQEVLAQAQEIHQERTEVRGDTWASFDHHDCIHHMSSKLARLKNAAQVLAGLSSARDRGDEVDEELVDKVIAAIEDDALDMINYSAFLVRHLTGNKPMPNG